MPYGVAVTPNSERVFITNQQSGSVSVMDAEALVVTYKTKVGRYPEGVVIEAARPMWPIGPRATFPC